MLKILKNIHHFMEAHFTSLSCCFFFCQTSHPKPIIIKFAAIYKPNSKFLKSISVYKKMAIFAQLNKLIRQFS